ncbi:glyoxalase superfamily protein [Martelella sp. HB161492]|uniref:glyoxalase superfamily protein n=1 Tax=Martelella sp. HB161492 TaxID=2720726 RepID=UPI001FEFB443|nr:glyoxalase superfamily protein [Martelella sp. HB161492]
MNTDNGMSQLPSCEDLKKQARRLRQALQAQEHVISHSLSLELIAAQLGYRDWNTLRALAARNADGTERAATATESRASLALGESVTGRYLGNPFSGKIIALQALGNTSLKLTIVFDNPVDVVSFESFSFPRRRINATIDRTSGISAARTSDGAPHLVVDL